jgi:hypothetical protein
MLLLKPQHCAAVYEMLRQLPPFDKAGLPDSDSVEFRAVNRKDICGEYIKYDPHIITISTAKNGHLSTVVATMAHEMTHLWQALDGTETTSQHNENFYLKARKVCKCLGLDPKAF